MSFNLRDAGHGIRCRTVRPTI